MDTGQNRNLEAQRRTKGELTYFDRGEISGADGKKYQRFAIQTHFVEVGEDQTALVERYVKPLYEPGDIVSFGAKVMAMCEGSVRTREQVKPGFFAKFLYRFAASSDAGLGVREPHKLQLVIDIVGLPRVLLAAFLAAVTKPFGKRGVFYSVCGHGVDGIDGFYAESSFDRYHDLGVINPKNPTELCQDLARRTGMPIVLMDANDFARTQLGKSDDVYLTDAQIQEAMDDNPSGQSDELTPFILIRPL